MRNCNECTKCCDGHIGGIVNGYKFGAGRPCFFVKSGVGCKIFKDRPTECGEFNCEWIRNINLPEELDPRLTDMVIADGIDDKHLHASIMGINFKEEHINLLKQYCSDNDTDLTWNFPITKETYFYGKEERKEYVLSLFNK